MAIDARIPLGVQPVQTQQPNMLGQYAQIMGIRAAQQDIEGNNALREAYASGGDLNDPEFRRRVMAANPKLGSELIKRNAETGKLQNEAIANRIKLSREMLTGVNTPEDYIAWHESNHKDPILGGYLGQRGITAEQSRAKIMADLAKPGGLDKLKRESALGATELQKELMQTERTRISAGPGYQQAALAQRQYEDKLNYGGDVVTTTIPNPENPKERMEIQARRDLRTGQLIPLEVAPMPMRVDISPSSATSAFQPLGGGAGGGVNALASQGAPASNVNALSPNAPQGPTFAQPKPTIRQPVAVMKDGKAVLVPPEQAIGMPPATADAEKSSRLQAQQVRDLGLAITNLESAVKPGGLISQSTGSGAGRAYDIAAGFVGNAPKGAIAAAKLAPIADMVLKMVPRFEGPQSDKDTQSYKEAAGQLANSNLPVEIRQEAGKEILRLMKERRDQFVSTDMAREGFGASPSSSARSYSPQEQQALEWANSNANDPRAAQIKQRLGVQ